MCILPKARKTDGSSLEGRRIPCKHLAILECLRGRRMRSPGHQSSFGNYFARNDQSKNGFSAALTELVVHEKHHVAGRKVFRASAGDYFFENRVWQTRE